jgi:hypothetical protein
VYVFTLGTLGWFLVLVASLQVRPGRMEHRAASLKVVLAGFQYMMRSSLLLGASSLDLFVVLLGGSAALMPIFAQEILHTGPRGLGLLRAAPAAGALMMSLAMARFPLSPPGAGLRLFVCVAIFGAGTVVFGLSRICGCRWRRWLWRARRTPSASSFAGRCCNWARRRRCAGA